MDDTSVDRFLRVNELQLEQELAMCASYYYTFASLEVEAEDLYEKATLALEIYEAELNKKVRTENPELAKGTQKSVEIKFREDLRWQELKRDQLEKQRNFRMLHKGASALEMKSRMLMSINRRDLFKQDKGFGRNSNDD